MTSCTKEEFPLLLVTSRKWFGFYLLRYNVLERQYQAKYFKNDLDVINAYPINENLILLVLENLKLITYDLQTEKINNLSEKLETSVGISMFKPGCFVIVTESKELKLLTFNKAGGNKIKTLITPYLYHDAIKMGNYIISGGTSTYGFNIYHKKLGKYQKIDFNIEDVVNAEFHYKIQKTIVTTSSFSNHIFSIGDDKFFRIAIYPIITQELICPTMSSDIVMNKPEGSPLVKLYKTDYKTECKLLQVFKGSFGQVTSNQIAIAGMNKITFLNRREDKFEKDYEIELSSGENEDLDWNKEELMKQAAEEAVKTQKQFEEMKSNSKFSTVFNVFIQTYQETYLTATEEEKLSVKKSQIEEAYERLLRTKANLMTKDYPYKIFTLIPSKNRIEEINFLSPLMLLPKVLVSLTVEFL